VLVQVRNRGGIETLCLANIIDYSIILRAHKKRQLEAHSHGPAFEPPVFLSHLKNNDLDPVRKERGIPQALDCLGFEVTWKQYEDGGHWINEPEGVDDIIAFLNNQI
jgi:predicted esterase